MRRATGVAIGVSLAWTFGSAAHAQEYQQIVEEVLARMSGTLEVYHSPQMAEGDLVGCAFSFETLQRDYAYLGGGYLRASGSVALMSANDNLGVAVKVVSNELTLVEDTLKPLPHVPTRVYLLGDDLTTNFGSVVGGAASDTGGYMAIFDISPSLDMIMSGLESGSLTVAFALGGSMDVQMPIDLRVVSTDEQGNRKRSDDAIAAFASCTQTLLARLIE